MMKSGTWLTAALFLSFLQPVAARAVTPEEFQDAVAQGERITLIDVRNQSQYQEDHIPGAINIPATVVGVKRLPPLGRVVVYGDGIRTDLTGEAVVSLNAKKGIRAEMLEGGFGRWQASRLQTTGKAGLAKTGVRYLSYQELKKASTANPEMVLVDLREKGDQVLTDLGEEFPLQSVVGLARGPKGWDISPCLEDAVRKMLFVLIDNGKEDSLEVARALTTAGIKRVVALVGGEMSLKRKGVSEKKTVVTTNSQP